MFAAASTLTRRASVFDCRASASPRGRGSEFLIENQNDT